MSVREQICVNMIETAKQMTEGAGYNFTWGSFFRHLAPDEPEDVPAFGMQDTGESTTQLVFPIHDRTLTVEVRGYHYVPDPEQAGTVANHMIADLERVLMQDVTRGGLAVDTRLIRNDTFIGYPATNGVTVSIVAEIDYRTLLTDPNQAK